MWASRTYGQNILGGEMDKNERLKSLMRKMEKLEKNVALLRREKEKVYKEMEQLINEEEE
ncbi:hypothetical protein ES702_04977 [subsurface metagenome]